MDELMPQFIVEARDLVQAAIDDLFVLRDEPDSTARLNSAFRAFHTLKGSAALFNLTELESVLHLAENTLARMRSGDGVLGAEQIDHLVAVLEWVEACVDDIESSGEIRRDLLEDAERLQETFDSNENAPATPANARMATTHEWAIALAAQVGGELTVALKYRPHPECFFSGDDPIATVSRVPLLRHVAIGPGDPLPASGLYDPFRSNLIFEVLSAAPISEVEAIFQLIPDQVEIVPLGIVENAPSIGHNRSHNGVQGARPLRIDAARIDALLFTIGELITIKNGVASLVSTASEIEGGANLKSAIATTQKNLDRVVGKLYADVLQTRMVPIAQAFRRLPRMVHDLSRRLGRPTSLVIEGDELEADKTIVDELFEPLLHLVRNAMDHGIEGPKERFQAGKPATAKLVLRAAQHGDRIILSLSDDGRGIDPDAIRKVAVGKGLMSAEQSTRFNDSAALDLLFAPGFSTAAAVNDLSGRGVGLDAVRTEITRLGGAIQLASRVGEGTTFSLSVPVSFAMSQLLVLSVAGERYGVPMQNVVQTVRVNPSDISPIRDNQAFVLRDRVIPLLSLSALLGLAETLKPADELTVLVLSLEDDHVGVIVDSIAERVETITRPLGGLLTGVRGIAGTTLLGDGQILLVLDVAELIK
jgi:two-component system chemotaxis sensor kinase CheA